MSAMILEWRVVEAVSGHDDNITVTLWKTEKSDLSRFKLDLQESFRVSAEAESGQRLEEPIPPDEDIEQSIVAPGSVVYWILADGERVGGAIVTIDEVTQHNSLSFFFISTSQQSRGFGYRAWKAIEKAHSKTRVWETVTPYFEKRNIHFYVNRCGFRIVEFFNRYNPDPHQHSQHLLEEKGDDEMFRFEKIMA